MSWKPEVQTLSDGDTWSGNGLRFATEDEARDYAADLAARWFSVTETRVIEVDDPITYAWVDDRLVPVKPGDVA